MTLLIPHDAERFPTNEAHAVRPAVSLSDDFFVMYSSRFSGEPKAKMVVTKHFTFFANSTVHSFTFGERALSSVFSS